MGDRYYEGAVKPSSIEKDAFDRQLGAMRSTDIPSDMQIRVAYGSNQEAEYVGYNDRGVAESTERWLLYYLEYDSSQRLVKRTIAYDSWDNRATASYS